MLKRTLTALALAMVGMAATPAAADLLVPDQVPDLNRPASSATIGIVGARVNNNPVASPGFLSGGVAGLVSIPANISDTITVTFAFHWPLQAPPNILGIQWQNRLLYDNSEVQVLGATGAGGWTAVNFGLGPNNSKMTATALSATQTGPNGTPLKPFPNPASGSISTAPAFGRFVVDAPVTFTIPQRTVDGLPIATSASGVLVPFSSTFPIMRVTFHVQSVIQNGLVDFIIPPTSAFLVLKEILTSTIMGVDQFGMVTTQTSTWASTQLLQGRAVSVLGSSHGGSVVPEPASAALMGIGLFSLVGGVWRRQRRGGEV